MPHAVRGRCGEPPRTLQERRLPLADRPQWRGSRRHGRPKTRDECAVGPRQCPYAECRHHLALDVTQRGNVTLSSPVPIPIPEGAAPKDHHHPDLDAMPETCSLDVADEGPHTLDDVGKALNIKRERARRIESIAMRKIRIQSPGLARWLEGARV